LKEKRGGGERRIADYKRVISKNAVSLFNFFRITSPDLQAVIHSGGYNPAS